jgi:hypothetical protein
VTHAVPARLPVLLRGDPGPDLVVDAANGPGTSFTDLATAVSTVPSGAVLLVRAGQYGSFTISGKSLTVLGEAGVTMVAPAANVAIESLGVGQRVVLHGLGTANSSSLTTFTCQFNAGEVVLDQVGGAATAIAAGRAVLRAGDRQRLLREQRQRRDDHGERRDDEPHAAWPQRIPRRNCCSSPARAEPQPRAPVGLRGRPQLAAATSPPAVLLQNAAVRADGGSLLHADTGFQATFGLAIAGSGSARLAPDVTLAGASPLVAPTVSVTTVDLPAVLVQGGSLGGVSAATMTGGLGRLGVLWIGLPGHAVAPFPAGDPLSIGNGVILASA